MEHCARTVVVAARWAKDVEWLLWVLKCIPGHSPPLVGGGGVGGVGGVGGGRGV